MECKQILKTEKSTAWSIHVDIARQELFVPEFCVYVIAVDQGQLSLINQQLLSVVSTQTIMCLPPSSRAFQLNFQDKSTVKILKIDAWYFISHFFVLPAVTTLPKISSSVDLNYELFQDLQEQHLQKSSLEQTQRIKSGIEDHTSQLSDKQVNRYLKSWFGLTLSKLKKIHQIEAFVKNDCNYTGTNTRLVDTIDYETFYDYSHFGHTFKSAVGKTPETYLASEGTVQSLFW